MSYFEDSYSEIRFPVQTNGAAGLRRSQLGAAHAIASHFTLRGDPAIVIMPTGSGKTAVLAMSAFLLRAKRVLVLVPSRLVRAQVTNEFTTLEKLTDVGVLSATTARPRVKEATERLAHVEEWNALREFDVVVGTPQSVSPSIDGVATPPEDLFDLVLVDEAHHSPAKTWNEAMKAFGSARRVLFTATPFRADAREIEGRFVYSYPVGEAYADGVFGDVGYIPVLPPEGQNPDIEIARATERTLDEDRAAGFDHVIMVRTDSKKRADELADLYRDHTALRLRAVHSSHSLSHIKRVLRLLSNGDLDGVIAVDMMGEGFDFPQLKIAAVHSPHKSLGVTLQFIGRFARTQSSAHIGAAKFLAIPSEIELDAQRLYEEQAVWTKIVPDLLQSRIDREVRLRTDLASFEDSGIRPSSADDEDISLYGFKPYFHVKVFSVSGDVDIRVDPRLPGIELVKHEVSLELQSMVLVLRSAERPDWTHLDSLTNVTHDLVIAYYDTDTSLLFICSSVREEWLYKAIADSLVSGLYYPLSPSRIYGALNDLVDLDFFNVGMRNRLLASNSESYRISAGSAAQKTISASDGYLYYRGHAYGRARDGETGVTIGLSSSSKLWSNKYAHIPDLVAWCRTQATRIAMGASPTGSELDFLQAGVEVSELPEGVIAATWSRRTFARPRLVYYRDAAGELVDCQLLDTELTIDRVRTDPECIWLALEGPELSVPLTYLLDRTQYFELAPGADATVRVGGPSSDRPLVQYLNGELPTLFFADGSSLEGRVATPPPTTEFVPFDATTIEVVDWNHESVDITSEKRSVRSDGLCSVHEYVESRLESTDAKVIFFDDGSGELADYLAIYSDDDEVRLVLYHCKAAGGAASGDRVDDVYDVVGQSVKSTLLVGGDLGRVATHARRRVTRAQPSTYLRGSIEVLDDLVVESRNRRLRINVVAVQPGVSRSELTAKIGQLLSMGSDAIRSAGCGFTVIGSA